MVSAPHPGSSGGADAVPGATGSGSSDPEGRSQSPRFGAGTAGGLGGNSGLGITGSFPAGGASAPHSGQGQPGVAPAPGNNSTPGGAVQR